MKVDSSFAPRNGYPLAGLARELGVSKYQLSHRFKRARRRRRSAATCSEPGSSARTALLADPHSSVTDVSLMTGFSDLARFDKLFKRHTGLTPSAYRAGLSGGRTP